MEFEEIKRRLAVLDTAAICDANKSLQVMDPSIRPIGRAPTMTGIARTVRCHEDFLTVIQALSDSVEDEILVIDSQNSRRALAGELFGVEGSRRGLGGIVIDGGIRDTKTLEHLGLPVYARFVIPVSGTANKIFETQVPVHCGGVEVHPGDIVYGDGDGIVVGKQWEIAAAIVSAEKIQSTEAAVLEKMNSGKNLLELLNFDEHIEAVTSGRPSELKFTL